MFDCQRALPVQSGLVAWRCRISLTVCCVCFGVCVCVCVLFPPTTQVLEKTFYMENPDEIVPEKFVGCTIDWAAGKDTTGEGHNLSTGQRGGNRGGGEGHRHNAYTLGGGVAGVLPLTVRLCTPARLVPQHNSRPTQLPARQWHPHPC